MLRLDPPSNVTVTINNTNYSALMQNVQASYSSLSLPESGLVLMTGTLVLVKAETVAIDFDVRYNNEFRRGSRIEIKHEDSFMPICGVAFIISADFDMQSTLSISFGCQLSLFNYRSAADIGVCLNFGAAEPLGAVVRGMLSAAGVSESNFNLVSFQALDGFLLSEPLLIGQGQSILQAAGALCAQYGAILIQLNDGTISIELINTDSEYVHWHAEEDLQAFTRQGQPETVISQMTFDYNQTVICSLINTESNVIRQGDTIVVVNENRDVATRTTESVVQEFRGSTDILVSETTVRSSFESREDAILRTGQVLDMNVCFRDNDSRILSREVISRSDNTEVLRAWLATRNTANNPANFNVSGTITASRVLETYSYSESQITKVTEVFQPAGRAIPLIADQNFGRNSGTITPINPLDLIIDTRRIETWTKSRDLCQRWAYVSTTLRNRNLVAPEQLDVQIQDVSRTLQQILDASLELVPVDRQVLFNQQEPSFETFEVEPEVIQQPQSIVVGSRSAGGFEVERRFNLGNFANIDIDYTTEYCSNIMDFINGRIYGMQISFNPFSIKDNWRFLIPFAKGKVRESLRGTSSVYLIDTPTLVLSPTEAVLSYAGSFIGFAPDINNTSAFADNLERPTILPNSRVLPVITLEAIDFNINTTLI